MALIAIKYTKLQGLKSQKIAPWMRAQLKEEYLTRAMVNISVFQLTCMPFIHQTSGLYGDMRRTETVKDVLGKFLVCLIVSALHFIFLGPNINNAVNSIHT